MAGIEDFDDLRVYRVSYECAMRIFELSKDWPKAERYALTDQIRRSHRKGMTRKGPSRAVCSNIAEAWSKRRYERHFISKLSTAEGEAAETLTWLDFARDCGYLPEETHKKLQAEYRKIRGGLVKMMAAPEKWCGPAKLREPQADYDID